MPVRVNPSYLFHKLAPRKSHLKVSNFKQHDPFHVGPQTRSLGFAITTKTPLPIISSYIYDFFYNEESLLFFSGAIYTEFK